jgi:hypothetical protein
VFQPSSGIPALVRQNIERCVADAVAPLGLRGGGGRNELFWAVQPSGCAIWDGVEAGLALEPEKLMYGEPRAEGVRLQVWRVDAIRAGRAQAAACWRWMGRRAGERDDGGDVGHWAGDLRTWKPWCCARRAAARVGTGFCVRRGSRFDPWSWITHGVIVCHILQLSPNYDGVM